MSAKYCTDCGSVLRDKNKDLCMQLYDEELYAKSGILKLVGCSECGAKVADKYVECDETLLLIDLVLQAKQAYRHVLLNGNYASVIMKTALLTVICDGYIGWYISAKSGEFFEQEYEFYVTCSKAVLAVSSFLATVAVTSLMSGSSKLADSKALLLGLLLSYSSRFFNLAALLWSQPTFEMTTPSQVMWGFVYLLFFISSVRVHQVIQGNKSWISSWVLLLIGHVVFYCLLNVDHFLFPTNLQCD